MQSQSGVAFGHAADEVTMEKSGVTRDPYRQLEEPIQKGQLKGYLATVTGTHWRADGKVFVDLKVPSQPAVYNVSMGVADVVGRL